MVVYARKVNGRDTGRWVCEVDYVPDPGNPNKKKRRRKVCKTLLEAQRLNKKWLKVNVTDRREAAQPGTLAPRKAAKTLAQRLQEDHGHSMEETAKGALEARLVGLNRCYVQCQTTYAKRFAVWLEGRKLSWEHVTTATFAEWRVALLKEDTVRGGPMSAASLNKHVIAARAVLQHLEDAKLLSGVPKGVNTKDKGANKRASLSPEDAIALVGALRGLGREVEADFLRVAILTGCRRGELLAAKPEHLTRAKPSTHALVPHVEASLYLPKTKIDIARTVVLGAKAEEILAKRLPWQTSVSGLRRHIGRAVVKLGWRGEGIDDPRGRFTLHWARHTNATWRLIGGASTRAVQAALGHRSIATTEGYTHVVHQLQTSSADSLERVAPPGL